jgi:hypothetical protein
MGYYDDKEYHGGGLVGLIFLGAMLFGAVVFGVVIGALLL